MEQDIILHVSETLLYLARCVNENDLCSGWHHKRTWHLRLKLKADYDVKRTGGYQISGWLYHASQKKIYKKFELKLPKATWLSCTNLLNIIKNVLYFKMYFPSQDFIEIALFS